MFSLGELEKALWPLCRSASQEENDWLFLKETSSVLQWHLVVAKKL